MATDFTVDRDTVKYVLNSSGDIASVAIDTPAIEYNTDGTYKGLLVEPASTNLCLQSEDISTTWDTTGGNATPTQSTEETPDGDTTNKYIKLVDNGSTGTGFVYVAQTITVSGGTKYTASVFLKKDGLNWARLRAFDTGGVDDDPYQYFDLLNGVTGTGSAGIQDATIEAYPNDWYRCSITWTQGAGDTSCSFVIIVADADNNTTVDLDGTSSIFVWGAQVEASPIATSYIPTTTASVTRNKDDISLTGASDLIGQGEGTLYVEVDWRLASGGDQLLLEASDGTANNRAFIGGVSGSSELRMYLQANNVTQTFQGESYTGYSGIQKFAFAYKTNDFELYRNGSSVSSDTVGSLAALATLTDIDIGQSFAVTAQANMHIRAVALYKTRLTNDQLADLTS
jgi:hypothetical protein